MTTISAYTQYCSESDAPLFHQPWWLDATGVSWVPLVSHKGDHIAGIWPVCLEKKGGIIISRNPPLTPYLGPHVSFPGDLKDSKRDSFEHQTVADLAAGLPHSRVWALALRPGFKQAGLLQKTGFSISARQTFLVDLRSAEEEALFLRLHEDYRRNIRKAAQEIEIANEPAELETLYQFQKATLTRKGHSIHYSFPYMSRLFDTAAAKGQTALWTARKDGHIQAILWQLWDKSRSYYLVGAQAPDSKEAKAVTALIWQAIRHSKQLGLQSFDFEGSMDPGVEAFFRNFGGQRELYLVASKENSLLYKLYQKLRK